ncbi:MAG: hypothetical protein QXR30_02810 [Candidatus Woesearchaeota archaeon]
MSVKIIRIILFLIWLFSFSLVAYSIQQSHPASEIEPGTFGTDLYIGNYSFPDSLSVANNLYVGQRVGIGVSNPRDALEVVGNLIVSGGNRYIGLVDNFALGIRTNNIDRIYITNSGNVGIGTTSPGYKLDVSGTMRSTDSTYLATTTGNVGIGTTSPSTKLHVVGQTRLQNDAATLQIVGTTHSYVEFYPQGISTRYGWFGYGSSGTEILTLMNSRNSDLRLGTNNIEIISINASGNVGIGTTSPEAKLHLKNTTGATSLILENTGGGSSTFQKWQISVTNWEGNNRDLGIGPVGMNPYLLIMDGGNVGIGTISPSTLLHLNQSKSYSVPTFGTTPGQLHITGNASGGDWYAITFGSSGSGGSVSTAQAGLYVYGSPTGNRMYLATTDNFSEGAKARVTILENGNVGIGTTNPQAKLTVVYPGNALNSYTAEFISNPSIAGAGGILFSQNSVYAYRLYTVGTAATDGHLVIDYINKSDGSSVHSNVFVLRNGNVGISTGNPGYKIDVAGTLRNTQDAYLATSSGNVGIGTTSPSTKLQVVGDIGLSGGDRFIGTIDNYALNLRTNNQERVTITNAGNVGVGTTNPGYKLDVSGTLRSTQDSYLATSSGNVGIGTTSPSYKLEVRSSSQDVARVGREVNSGGARLNIGLYNNNSVMRDYVAIEGLVVNNIAGAENGSLVFYTMGNGILGERMRITHQGNVGIGTTTANDKLEVAGNVRAVQFIDRDNTNYYLDPSNTGTSLRVAGSIRVDGNNIQDSDGTARILLGGTTTINGSTLINGKLNISTINSGSTNSVLIESSGEVQKRTIDSRVWGSSLVDYNDSSANYLAKFLDSDTITKSIIYENGSNVGIGTTSPGYKLDVSGTLRSTQDAYLATSSGNVGIGTTDPQAKLHVEGKIRVNNAIQDSGGTDRITFSGTNVIITIG